MSIQGQFERFYSKINLSVVQSKEAKAKYDGVCEQLHSHYYGGKYGGRTKKLIGSYGKQTNIRPPRDVDVLFVMPRAKFGQYKNSGANGPSELLSDIREILKEKYPDPEIKNNRKVVVVKFAKASHNVEVLPGWKNENGTFKIPDSRQGGTWDSFDPLSENRKIQDANSRTHRASKLVRIVKKWQANRNAQLSSYNIEQAVLGFFQNIEEETRPYSTLVRDFFQYFKSRNKLGSINTAYNIAINACVFEANGNTASATKEWQGLFGPEFPGSV